MRISKSIQTSCVAIALMLSSPLLSAKEETPPVKTIEVSKNIHMLMGKGGNVGVFSGKDGTLMIDDQFAPMGEKLLTAIKAAGGESPKFLINTHFHGDHTGGNEKLGKTGAIIMAHDNVRKRLSSETFIKAFNMKSPPQPPAALPVVTFTESMTLHINDETVEVKHISGAHTDGDSVIHFKNANAIHMGDLFFNGFFPFIDTGHGGSLKGMIDASDAVLTMVDDNTKIIPGHGPLASKSDLQAYRDMLAEALKRFTTLRKEGKSLKDVLAAKSLADLDEKWGKGFLNTNKWVSIIYPSIK